MFFTLVSVCHIQRRLLMMIYVINVSFLYYKQKGILRYKVDLQSLEAEDPIEDFDLDDY